MLDIKALETWLWDAACSIRGNVDAPKFKDYILPLIFLKRLSDVFEDELAALGPSACLALNAHHDKQSRVFAALGAPFGDDSLVFSHGGEPWHCDSISKSWLKMGKKAGVRHIRFHDARHTHASLLLKQGVNAKVIQERLGHSTITLTLDTYSHLTPGMQEAAAAGYDAAIQQEFIKVL